MSKKRINKNHTATKQSISKPVSNKGTIQKANSFTIMYLPMGMALGWAVGTISENPVNGILIGLAIGAFIDYIIFKGIKKINIVLFYIYEIITYFKNIRKKLNL